MHSIIYTQLLYIIGRNNSIDIQVFVITAQTTDLQNTALGITTVYELTTSQENQTGQIGKSHKVIFPLC